MNKTDLINAIADEVELSKTDITKAVNAFIEVVVDTVKNDDDVTLIGFGTFTKKSRAERTGRNPRTGEEITIPASYMPSFKAGKQFKEVVNS